VTASATSGGRLTAGDAAPPVELPDTNGRQVRLDPSAHAATVVVFTANGCPFALAWHDRVQAVARDFAGRDVVVLQIVSNDETGHPEDSVAAMRERVANGDLAGPFLRDADQQVARAFGATATPEIFVVDRGGVVRYHGAPDGDHDDPSRHADWLRTALEDILAGRPVVRLLHRWAVPSSGASTCCGGTAVRRTNARTSCSGPRWPRWAERRWPWRPSR